MKNFWICAITAILVSAASTSTADESPQMSLQRITLSAGIHQIDTQVAVTQNQHFLGLMYRSEMPVKERMLLVF